MGCSCGDYRCLRPSGFVLIEVPFLQHYHPSPQDFYRFTIEGIKQLCADFSPLEVGIAVGPMVTVVEMVESFSLLLLGERNIVKGFVRLVLYPLRVLDPLLVKLPLAHSVANGFYLIGQKP